MSNCSKSQIRMCPIDNTKLNNIATVSLVLPIKLKVIGRRKKKKQKNKKTKKKQETP